MKAEVGAVHDAIDHLDIDAIVALPLDDALRCVHALAHANRDLARTRSLLEHALAQTMPDDMVTVDDTAVFKRHRKANRKQWDREALLRDVLDTRLVDETTGEINDPTPLDKVLHVWLLGDPRVTALRARGLDPDEYCTTERGGFTIEVIE